MYFVEAYKIKTLTAFIIFSVISMCLIPDILFYRLVNGAVKSGVHINEPINNALYLKVFICTCFTFAAIVLGLKYLRFTLFNYKSTFYKIIVFVFILTPAFFMVFLSIISIYLSVNLLL
jgi:hypothetical protein